MPSNGTYNILMTIMLYTWFIYFKTFIVIYSMISTTCIGLVASEPRCLSKCDRSPTCSLRMKRKSVIKALYVSCKHSPFYSWYFWPSCFHGRSQIIILLSNFRTRDTFFNLYFVILHSRAWDLNLKKCPIRDNVL